MKFNLTPIIDIVFLLIIFLVVVCRQIDAENFEISLPDKCQFAQAQADNSTGLITITVTRDSGGKYIIFAVGSPTWLVLTWSMFGCPETGTLLAPVHSAGEYRPLACSVVAPYILTNWA